MFLDPTGWLSPARQPPGRMEACAAWTEAEAGSGGEATAEAADAAESLEEAAATPTTNYVLMLLCTVSVFFFVKKTHKNSC